MTEEIDIDESLLESAADFTGVRDASELCNLALRALIETEAARRLARLGGS